MLRYIARLSLNKMSTVIGWLGSCVLKASVDRVSVDTIGRYGDRHSADISTDTRPILGRVSVDMNQQACRPTPGRYFTATRPLLGRHSAATRPPLSRHLAATQMPLGWYFTNTRPTLSSPGQLLLPPEFYLPCSTERDCQWPSSFFGL